MSIEEGIQTVFGGGGHVVILGAGASIAATKRNPEKSGKILPSMDNFIDVVGLKDIVDDLPENLRKPNFEDLYSTLYALDMKSPHIKEIERRVKDYFGGMELPDEPTIYDYMVMSLRSKDLIATFNWDPFLYQAFCRNQPYAEMPHLSFLHGNVAIGYSKEEQRAGAAGGTSKKTFNYFEPTQLLFPITQKDYNQDEFTDHEWGRVKYWLGKEEIKRITIFGYGAPDSDVEAVRLLNTAWGTPETRVMEQVEIVDIRTRDELSKLWKGFIHAGHYDVSDNFFESSLAYHPRRTSESWVHYYEPVTIDHVFREPNPIPQNFKSLQDMWDWFSPLIRAEEKWKSEQPEE